MTMASAPGVPTPTVPLVLDEQMLTKEEIYYQVSKLMNAEQCAMTLHHIVSDTGLHSFRVIGTLTFNPFQCDFILDLTHNFCRFNVDIDLQTNPSSIEGDILHLLLIGILLSSSI